MPPPPSPLPPFPPSHSAPGPTAVAVAQGGAGGPPRPLGRRPQAQRRQRWPLGGRPLNTMPEPLTLLEPISTLRIKMSTNYPTVPDRCPVYTVLYMTISQIIQDCLDGAIAKSPPTVLKAFQMSFNHTVLPKPPPDKPKSVVHICDARRCGCM